MRLIAHTNEEAEDMLEACDGLHDATLLSTVTDYSNKHIDLLLSGLCFAREDQSAQSATLRFEQIDRLIIQVPFIGGEIRVEGVDLRESREGTHWTFDLTTTEWLDSDEFRVIRLEVDARKVRLLLQIAD